MCERLTERKREKKADRQKGNFPLWTHTAVSMHYTHVFIQVWCLFGQLLFCIKKLKITKQLSRGSSNAHDDGHTSKLI